MRRFPLRLCLKVSIKVFPTLVFSGHLFHNIAAATENALQLYLYKLNSFGFQMVFPARP